MKKPDLVFAIALMTATSLLASRAYSAEVPDGGRAGGDRDASAPLVQHSADHSRQRQVAEGGADRLRERQLASDGGDRVIERQVAADGADRLKARQLASDGSDHLKQNRVADSGYGSDYGSEVTPYFCMACR